MEEKIVPAYMKNNTNEPKESGKKKKTKTLDKKKIKLIIFIVVGVILLASIIYGIIYLIRVIKYAKYNVYSTQIEKYGLDIMYDNGKTTSHESASRAEALKLIVSSIKEIKNFDPTEHNEKYKNEDIVKYAIQYKILEENQINEANVNDTITYIEFLTYYMNALVKLKKVKLDTSIYPNFNDIAEIKGEELYAVSDLVAKGVLENEKVNLDPHRKLYKGELNKIACDIIKAYNLVVPTGEKFNISEEKVPKNADKYSYILYGVDKEVYEKDLIIKKKENFIEPYKTFALLRIGMNSTIKNVNNYYNAILNVDYENINVSEFKQKIDASTAFDVENDDVVEYVKYLQENKIKIKGTAKTQMPIVYNDGIYYRMRVKIEFEVLNSDTTKNLIYGDILSTENDIEYKDKKYSFYIDAVITKLSKSGSVLYVYDKDLYSTKIDEKIDGIEVTKKEDNSLVLEEEQETEPEDEKDFISDDDIG